MKVNLETVGKVCMVVSAIGGVVVAVISQMQLKKTADLVGTTVKDLSKLDAIEVKEELVNQAIDAAVEAKVDQITGKVYDTVYAETQRKANEKVKLTVVGLYSEIEQRVTDKIAIEVAKIDQEKLKKEVTAKAKEAIVAKFDGQLDDQLVEFNRNLENVGKIYQSIAQKMDPGTGSAGKSVNLTLG